MKIFSQSTACALIAVANAGPVIWADPIPTTYDCIPRAMAVRMAPVRSECVFPMDGENCDTWTVQINGGWNRGWTLPVPEPTCIKPGNTSCYMSHLPTRGKTDERMERINCSSTELTAFRNGYGPNDFLGFFQEEKWDTDRTVEDCYLIVNGKMIPVYGSCFEALANNENNRRVYEDVSRISFTSLYSRVLKSPDSPPSVYYY